MNFADTSSVNVPIKKSSNLWQNAWKRFKRDRSAVLATVVILVIVTAVMFAPFIYTVSVDRIDFANSAAP